MKAAYLGLFLGAVTCNAHAMGRFADVQIIDRESGAVLEAYRYHGEYWVAGAPGHRYSISIRNQRGDRVLAVTTVDGVNVISGETGAWGQSGYVYRPAEAYDINGWRKSDREIADFEFTASPNSYAERTGRPANVGVIGIALFLERALPPPAAYAAPQDAFRSGEAQANAAARAIPQASGDQARSKAETPGESQIASASPPPMPTAKLGTGHGAREASAVYTTEFERQSSTPNEVIHIRYDSFENLTARGVVPRRSPGDPNPFPQSALSQYVPDPPGGAPFIRR